MYLYQATINNDETKVKTSGQFKKTQHTTFWYVFIH